MSMLVRGGAGTGSSLPATATPGQVLQWNGSAWVAATPSASGTTPNATPTGLGLVQLAGDLAGTATAPTIPALTSKADKAALAPVATSGSYGDLTGRPLLAPVATSGSYGDLTGRPATPLYAVKTAAEDRSSDATPHSDAQLTFPALTAGTYALEGLLLFFSSSATAGDASVQLAHTGTATGSVRWLGVDANDAVNTIIGAAYSIDTPVGLGVGTAFLPANAVQPLGSVTVAAGVTLSLAWSQYSSSTTPTTLRAGSWLRLTKIA